MFVCCNKVQVLHSTAAICRLLLLLLLSTTYCTGVMTLCCIFMPFSAVAGDLPQEGAHDEPQLDL